MTSKNDTPQFNSNNKPNWKKSDEKLLIVSKNEDSALDQMPNCRSDVKDIIGHPDSSGS